MSDESATASGDGDSVFGHLVVERSGGIGGLLLVWDVDIDSSEHREQIGPTIAQLPWQGDSAAQAAAAVGDATGAGTGAGAGTGVGVSADRYVYVFESRFGLVRFGEAEMPKEWKHLVDQVREITEPEHRRPGSR
ncbi:MULTISPECIES: hypothetical protein [Brevibacterium]|uniref:Uncharacterized protein n=2 Tax=Brevibacterium antiquum TaxID=234835 RepID=A0A2H1JZB9_9MICO|nr:MULTISPECIES: hypothetical protein [Brevibacterium]SMX84082.1 hypothetical protein BANT10_01795 [Brevibacterium antiquum]SMX92887.1 hypothetical protein BANT918_01986 [Brevibacterium antiquum CNRZ 918]HCG55006.1 hypothetical protein [Brevibacterium sp.]